MHSAEQELYEEFVELVEAEGLELDLHGRGGKGDVEGGVGAGALANVGTAASGLGSGGG